jgi:hypothetical protein
MDQRFVTFRRELRGGIALGDESHTNMIAKASDERICSSPLQREVALVVSDHTQRMFRRKAIGRNGGNRFARPSVLCVLEATRASSGLIESGGFPFAPAGD